VTTEETAEFTEQIVSYKRDFKMHDKSPLTCKEEATHLQRKFEGMSSFQLHMVIGDDCVAEGDGT
jgi:hypothetical protein